MKKSVTIIFIMLFTLNSFAQSNESKKLFTLDGNDIGGYVGLNGRFTTVNSLGAGLIDLRLAIVINKNWAVGYNSSGLINDRHLSTLVSDGVYHLMGSYKGIFVERIFEINENLKYSVSLLLGEGTVKYEYCLSTIADRKWYEEIIDQADFYLVEPTLELNYNLVGNAWVGMNVGYNLTSKIRLMDTRQDLMNNFNGGISFKYGLF